MRLESIDIDTAKYELKPGAHAFGVRAASFHSGMDDVEMVTLRSTSWAKSSIFSLSFANGSLARLRPRKILAGAQAESTCKEPFGSVVQPTMATLIWLYLSGRGVIRLTDQCQPTRNVIGTKTLRLIFDGNEYRTVDP